MRIDPVLYRGAVILLIILVGFPILAFFYFGIREYGWIFALVYGAVILFLAMLFVALF